MVCTILHGDNARTLFELRYQGYARRITLAYLDPPFMTNTRHLMSDGRVAFDDRWPSRTEYLDALSDCMQRVRPLLAPHGCIVLHVDPRTSHYVKVRGDEVFGDDAFASEIIWRYRRWPSKTLNFQRVHDVLLRWRKDPKTLPRWNACYEPLAPSTRAAWGVNKQRAIRGARGQRTRSSTTQEPSPGVPMGDVWDIGIIAPSSPERTGYPTQKPEALLERLLSTLTHPGDLVLDPYMGSGTALAVADRLARDAIGIDSSSVAVEVASQRLDKQGTPVAVDFRLSRESGNELRETEAP